MTHTICKECRRKIKYSGNTTNMRAHLTRHISKTLLAQMQQAKGSSQAPKKTVELQQNEIEDLQLPRRGEIQMYLCSGMKKKTYILLFIGSNGSDISSKATVAASIDLLVIKASGIKAYSLLSFLKQGSLNPLYLQDLGLDIYREINNK